VNAASGPDHHRRPSRPASLAVPTPLAASCKTVAPSPEPVHTAPSALAPVNPSTHCADSEVGVEVVVGGLALPSAWQAASEAEAHSARGAQHWLAPWLAGGASVVDAQAAGRALLGRAPVLEADALSPGPNNRPINRRFGSTWRPLVPAAAAGKDFGLFEGISEARVDVGFEGDGLRTRVTWRGGPR
jgi:hypothetical protein